MRASARLLAALAAALLAAVTTLPLAAAARRGECTQLVQQYMSDHTHDFEAPHDINKLIFFLHVPRTAGKTYANCFLRTALPPSQRCAKSYDTVRLNVSSESCRVLVSHDDYSISQWFPEGASTITQLRRPIDRIISAYEFAVDIAAKGVLHLGPPRRPPKHKRKPDFVGTLDVWPWNYLIPWFKWDMVARMERLKEESKDDLAVWREFKSPDNRTYWWNEAKNKSVWTLPAPEAVLDPFNNSLVMPLHKWIEHPIAHELINNGGTLQVLGLTNYSYWEGHRALRGCMANNSIAREMLLNLAVKRLKGMAHVGLTEYLEKSVLSLAADLGLKLGGEAYKYTSATAFSYDGGAVDDSEPITFKATTEGGKNVTMSRRDATLRIHDMTEEIQMLKPQIAEMTPRLNALVDKEAKWLEEQDALLNGDATSADGGEEEAEVEAEGPVHPGSRGGNGGSAAGSVGEQGAAAAGGEADADGVEGGPVQPGAEPEADGEVSDVAVSAGGGGGDGKQVEPMEDEVEEEGGNADSATPDALDGDSEDEGQEGQAAGSGDGGSGTNDEVEGMEQQQEEGEEGAAAGAADAAAGRSTEESDVMEFQQQPAPEAAGGETVYADGPTEVEEAVLAGVEEEEGEGGRIESPWADEIELLDDKLATMQERLKHLESELSMLYKSDLITAADEATGRARQLLPDEHFLLQQETLSDAYLRCAGSGKQRTERRKPYQYLRTPQGETFTFTSEARSKISEATKHRIHQLNALDEEIWRVGEQLLTNKLKEQEQAGLLESFPPASPPPDSAHTEGTSKKRTLQSTPAPKKKQKGNSTTASSSSAGSSINSGSSFSGSGRSSSSDMADSGVSISSNLSSSAALHASEVMQGVAAAAHAQESPGEAAHDEL